VLAEYLEPEGRFRDTRVEDTIVLYGSARIISREDAERRLADAEAGKGDVKDAQRLVGMSRFYDAARELSKRLTQWSKGLTESDRQHRARHLAAARRRRQPVRQPRSGLSVSLFFHAEILVHLPCQGGHRDARRLRHA
jgi:hypothetical protein